MGSSLGWTLSWLSPLTLAAAALWFGAAGLLAAGHLPALPVAIVAALIGAFVVRAIMNAFVRSSTEPLQLTAEGALATVNATIRPDSPGEVIYTLEGLHRSLPARSELGLTIPRGSTVVITRRSDGFAWVEPVDPLDNLTQSPN
jgi:membrane protein implicated in regulation of membrane protease activity